MDGGYVHRREAAREYWTRQWSMVPVLPNVATTA
jgi:hypothetical protein